MNIRDHIEAGHYSPGPRLVPMRNGQLAEIYTTNHVPSWPIAGSVPDASYDGGRRLACWRADGTISSGSPCAEDLLPPPSRKVEVKRYLVLANNELGPFLYREVADDVASNNGGRVVELTGSYEEPWS